SEIEEADAQDLGRVEAARSDEEALYAHAIAGVIVRDDRELLLEEARHLVARAHARLLAVEHEPIAQARRAHQEARQEVARAEQVRDRTQAARVLVELLERGLATGQSAQERVDVRESRVGIG